VTVQLAVSLDVEPDCDPQWRRSKPLSFDNIFQGIGDFFHPLCNSLGTPPTYLVTVEVLENRKCIEFFRRLEGTFELGLHLHPEFVEPRKSITTYDGSVPREFLSRDHSPDVRADKIRNAADLFVRAFDRRPTSFRAGRFSVDGPTLGILSDLGFTVDSSVTPFVNWARQGGPDFSRCDRLVPYHPSRSDALAAGSLGILEIPVTILPRREFLPNRWYTHRWFRPSLTPFRTLKNIADETAKSQSPGLLNMMFHSMELKTGCSPYSRYSFMTYLIRERIRKILSYTRTRYPDIKPVTLAEVAGASH
jgi:hypothetical protein